MGAVDHLKFHLAERLNQFGLFSEPMHSVGTEIHGVRVQWNVFDRSLLQDLCAQYPSTWTFLDLEPYDFKVTWVAPGHVGRSSELWEDADPECRFCQKDGVCLVIQRDFVLAMESSEIILVADYELSDGIGNFLRWLLPKVLLRRNKILLHSSAVLDRDGRARLCLGPSGAGKTTISSFAESERVLGDDMNLLERFAGKWFVTPAAVGQAIQERSLLGRRFEIDAFYLLEKSDWNEVSRLEGREAFLPTSAGVANLFWKQMSLAEVNKVQSLLHAVLAEAHFFRLKFNLDGKVWQDVDFQRQKV